VSDPGVGAWGDGLFRSLLEAAPDAMVIADATGRIVLVNAQVEALFGYARTELIGAPVEVLVPERFGGHVGFRAGYLEEPRTRPMGLAHNLFARRRDGSEFPVEISLAPLRTDEGMLVSAAVRDISERRRMEAETARVKDEFFATLSHELRTPLTSLIGYGEMLAEHEHLTDQGAHFLSVMMRSAERELRLVEDLLTLVQIEQRGLAISARPIDLRTIVAQSVETAEPLIGEAGLSLDVWLPDLAVPVEVDGDRLAQALDNLLSNAAKFTPRDGAIVVRLVVEGEHAIIEVADTGPGLGVSDHGQVFERLFRAPSAVEHQVPGAGLGLSIAHAIVSAHGGEIAIPRSGPGGTTFRVQLPLLAAPLVAGGAAHPQSLIT